MKKSTEKPNSFCKMTKDKKTVGLGAGNKTESQSSQDEEKIQGTRGVKGSWVSLY